MTNLLLSLLVPSVTADSNEKPSGPLANQPLAAMNELPVSFKEVLAMVDRYGAEAKTIAQIKQELQSLALDAKSQEKFLSDLQSGKGSEDAFAGLGMPGLIPAITSPNYHAVAAVVDFVPAVAAAPEIPLTSLPMDSVLPTADAEFPEQSSLDNALSSAASEPSELSGDVLPQTTSTSETAALAVEPLTEAELLATSPQAAPSGVAESADIVTSVSMTAMQNDPALAETITALYGPTDEKGTPVPVRSLSENRDLGLPRTLDEVSMVIPEEARQEIRLRMSGREEVPAEPVLLSAQPSSGRAATPFTPSEKFENALSISSEMAGVGPAGNPAASRPTFDASLAADPRMVQLQLQVRPGQPLGDQLRVHIRQAVAEGNDQISIRLMPEHLGRIEVAIDMATDGSAQVRVLADKAETFDLLQRDARGLERALTDAGIKADSGSLQFQLRGEGQGQQAGAQSGFGDGRGYGQGRPGAEPTGKGSGQDILPVEDNGLYRLVATTGVNIRV